MHLLSGNVLGNLARDSARRELQVVLIEKLRQLSLPPTYEAPSSERRIEPQNPLDVASAARAPPVVQDRKSVV